jgi:hypothetical protein
MVNITKLAVAIRSKNAKPSELTLDILFKNRKAFEKARKSGVLTEDLVARLYHIPRGKVLSVVWFTPGIAFKATIARPIMAGDPADTDIYGAQQHVPLLSINIPDSPRKRRFRHGQ